MKYFAHCVKKVSVAGGREVLRDVPEVTNQKRDGATRADFHQIILQLTFCSKYIFLRPCSYLGVRKKEVTLL